jgi:pimeloyl-ACP methyl ester carboxylesterase
MRLLYGLILSLTLAGLLLPCVHGQEKKETPKGGQEKKEKETPKGGQEKKETPKGGQEKKETPKKEVIAPPAPSLKHLDGRKIVFVANGVGGSTIASDNLIELNGEHRLCLLIKPVAWSRQNSVHQDMVDHDAQLAAAARIAAWTKALRKDAPNAEIYYVGHSAGARVVLAAAEMAGEKSVDRIILLHPAISTCYDLKNALKASKCGIDSFYASEDSVLATAEDGVGMADGIKARAAGRVGFHAATKSDAEAYRSLRQYRWNENFAGSGGHFAWTLQHNMRKVIVPLF